MKNLQILLLVILFPYYLVCQDVKWGQVYEAPYSTYTPKIIGEDSTSLYIVGNAKHLYFIEKYKKEDLSLTYKRFVNSIPILGIKVGGVKQYTNGLDTRFLGASIVKDTLILFGSKVDDKTKQISIIPYLYNKTNDLFHPIDSNFLVFESKLKMSLIGKNIYEKCTIYSSPDQSKVIIYYSTSDENNNITSHNVWLYDAGLNLLAEREESYIPQRFKQIAVRDFFIDTDGSFYFRKVVSKSEQYIVSYDAKKEYKKWEERIDISKYDPGAEIMSISFNNDQNGDLAIVGYFTHKDDMEGCFYVNINRSSKKLEDYKINEFDDDLTKRLNKSIIKNFGPNRLGFKDFFSELQVVNKNDGGVIIIGENYGYYDSYVDGVKLGGRYAFGDVIVISLAEDGDLLWAKRIPKRHFWEGTLMEPVGGEQYFSFSAFSDSERLYIIYNDKKANLDIENDKKAKTLNHYINSIPVIVSYELKTGESTKGLYKQSLINGFHLKPMVFHQREQGSPLFIYTVSGEKYKYGRIDLAK